MGQREAARQAARETPRKKQRRRAIVPEQFPRQSGEPFGSRRKSQRQAERTAECRGVIAHRRQRLAGLRVGSERGEQVPSEAAWGVTQHAPRWAEEVESGEAVALVVVESEMARLLRCASVGVTGVLEHIKRS